MVSLLILYSCHSSHGARLDAQLSIQELAKDFLHTGLYSVSCDLQGGPDWVMALWKHAQLLAHTEQAKLL